MTLQHTQVPAVASSTDFDLDLSIVSSGPVVADLMRSTDDGCGATCQSACSNSTC
jgi:FxLD family lantipeptide